MGRLPRVYIEGILYYVTSRSGHNQNLFMDFLDYQEYLSLIDKYKRQYGFKLFAYVLLPTHLHMLLELKNNVSISSIMHDINSLYTKIFNGRYKKKGHLFQARFKTAFAQKESYLLPLVRHTVLNPKRLRLVDDPKDYPYSSYSQIITPEKRPAPDMQQEREEIFTMLKGRENVFGEYVANIDQRLSHEFRKRIHKKRILGSKDFEQYIKNSIEESLKAQKKRQHLSKKARLVIVAVAGVFVFLATITIDYFYRRSVKLRSKYDKTLARYQNTLQMLIRERDRAVKSEEDIEKYQWKIKLTEKALAELRADRRQALQAQQELEGYAWRIKFTQIGGQRIAFANTDIIYFKDNWFNSTNLVREGFSASRYSKTERSTNRVIWETVQNNAQGGSVSWRGEWDGQKMTGVMSLRSTKEPRGDFSFVSIGERIKR